MSLVWSSTAGFPPLPSLADKKHHDAYLMLICIAVFWWTAAELQAYPPQNDASSYLHRKIHEDKGRHKDWTSNGCSEIHSHNLSLADTSFPLPPLGCWDAAVLRCRDVQACQSPGDSSSCSSWHQATLTLRSACGLWQNRQTTICSGSL